MNIIQYAPIYFFVILFAYIYKRTNNKLYYYISYLILTIFTACRFDVGPDYQTYVNAYYSTNSVEYSSLNDYFIFSKLSKLFQNAFRGYMYVFAIYAIAINYLVFSFLRKKNCLVEGLFCFLLLGFFFDSMDRLRQYLAICIFLNLIYLLEQKKRIIFSLLIIILSVFVHKSILVIIFFVPFFYVMISKKVMFYLIFIFTILSLMGVMNLLWKAIFYISPYSEVYSGTDYMDKGGFSSGFGFIFNILITTIGLLYSDVPKLYKNILFYGLLIYIIASGNLNLARFSAYFMILNIYIIPNISLYLKNLFHVKKSLYILIFIFFIRDVNRTNFEYRTFFSTEFLLEEFQDRN